MKAAELSGILRQIGLTFIVCLLLQVRVDDGRLVLLGLQGAAMAWQLDRLRGFAESPEARRAWTGAFGAAGACAVLGLVGLIPAVEPGTVNLLAAILLLLGTISYCSLLAHWSRRTDWADAVTAFDRARLWCAANLVVLGAAVGAHLVLGPAAGPGDRGSFEPGILLGRVLRGWPVLVVLLAATVLWIGAMVSLQLANRQVRAGLRAQPEAIVARA
ncbi:MAG: hypothetical protein R2702_04690 [Acidimicrobiales bacterium]